MPELRLPGDLRGCVCRSGMTATPRSAWGPFRDKVCLKLVSGVNVRRPHAYGSRVKRSSRHADLP
jgi:hypothetical protein